MQEDKTPHHDGPDRQYWQQYCQATHSREEKVLPEVDPNALASYLDGTANADQIESIERRLAVDEELLEAVIELHQIREAVDHGKGSPVPLSVIAAAKEIVRATHEQEPDETTPTPIRIGWRPRLQWAMAAVCVLSAGWAGYRLGLNTYTEDASMAPDLSALAIDLEDLFEDPSIPLVAVVAGGGI